MIRNILLTAGLVACVNAGVAIAAETPSKADIDTTVEMARTILGTERQAIVAKNMQLTDKESEPFWKVYREYKAERDTVRDRYTKILKTFAEKYGTMQDAEAKTMMKDYLAWEGEETKLKTKYVKKFATVIPDTKVMRFFQIENKIDSVIKFEMAKNVPLTP